MADTTNKEELSKKVITLADDTAEHLLHLEKIIKENKAEDSNAVLKKQEEIEKEMELLLKQISSENDLTQDAQTRLAQLKGTMDRLAVYQNQQEQKPDDQNTKTIDKVQAWIDKRGLPASIAAGAVSMVKPIYEGVKKEKGLRKIWGFFKGAAKGLRNGLIVGGGTRLATKGISLGISAWKGMQGALDFLKNPVDSAVQGMKNIGAKIHSFASGWWNKILGKTEEKYDPRQREIGLDKEDSNKETPGYEGAKIYMSDANTISLSIGGKTETLPMTTNMSDLSPEVDQELLDNLYNDPNLTDKTLMMNTISGIRIQAAQKDIQGKGLFGNKGGKQSLVSNLEAKRFNLQKLIEKKASKEEVIKAGTDLIDSISTYEKDTEAVIGNDRETKLLPLFHNYVANVSSPKARESHREQTQLVLYDAFRKTGGITHGDSDVVKEQLLIDLQRTPKYANIMQSFADNSIMEGLYAGTINKNTIIEKVTSAFTNDPQFKNMFTPALAEKLAQTILTTYKNTYTKLPKQENTMKDMLHRRYKDVATDPISQQEMITDYENAYGDQLNVYAKSKGIEYETNKRKIVREFARDLMKKSTLSTAVQTAFQDEFLQDFLPTQMDSQDNTTKEGLLCDIIGAGKGNLADSSINSAINIGIQMGLMCIPIGGAQMAMARLASRGILIRLAAGAIVGHVLHTTVNTLISNHPETFIADMFNRREFGKNAVFYGVLGQLGTILKALNISGKIASTGIVSAEQLTKIGASNRGSVALGATEGMIVGTSGMLFDPAHQRHWKDVIITMMLSTALHSNLKDKLSNYVQTITKGKDGKPQITLKAKSATTTLLHNELNTANKMGLGFDKKLEKRASEGKEILNDKGVSYILKKQDDGVINIFNGFGKVVPPSDKILNAAIKRGEAKIAAGLAAKTQKALTNSPKKLAETIEKAGIAKSDFTKWCKEHKLTRAEKATLGDFFKLIGEGKYKELFLGTLKRNVRKEFLVDANGKRIIDQLTGKPKVEYREIPYTLNTSGALKAGYNNASKLFTIGSVAYGGILGDEGGDAGRKEGLENYLLYGVVARTIPGKIITYMIDQGDIVL